MIHRPHYHFTPPQNFMNDPNGLVYYDGEYHLFYQHNPYGNVWGHMSWGHAISRDLLHWEHLPVALHEEDGAMIFSGSAVVDWKNTGGFGTRNDPPLIAIYTGHTETEQTQNIAYSADRGRTWTKYAGNPVIAIGSRQFRDPKVLWHEESRQWIMVAVLADQQKARFFSSPDLKHWTPLSDFGPAGQTDNEWECPDLFSMNVEDSNEQKLIMKVDVNHSILGQYFVGRFDGKYFINDHPNEQVLRVDYGRDFYAAQSWNDAPNGRRVWIGWMNNWDYANVIPTSPWGGMFSIPRELSLKQLPEGLRLVQQPIEELKQLRKLIYHLNDSNIAMVNTQLATLKMGIGQEIMAEFAAGAAGEFGIKIRSGANEETVIGYDTQVEEVFVDRARSGDSAFSDNFAGIHRAPLAPEQGRIKLRIFMDSCSVEVFGNDGRAVISDLIFPTSQSRSIETYAIGGNTKINALDIWELS
jgi:fructan beta-fructosidase